jgi:hypothetical protein
MTPVVVVGTGITVGRPLSEEVVDAAKHRVGDRDHGFLVVAMAYDSAITRAQAAVFGARGGAGYWRRARTA